MFKLVVCAFFIYSLHPMNLRTKPSKPSITPLTAINILIPNQETIPCPTRTTNFDRISVRNFGVSSDTYIIINLISRIL
ncbi:hypothetical protein L596_026764 [Steinernema carpocapsae]|uniref:Uncharacterized protein n=1 Tax=Steinernema carpocapsae TaxID=34508 RepID=A0A4U5M2D4_STECR|nr:hypothetical protein L596_026764 [Steinernema carpocapsae]